MARISDYFYSDIDKALNNLDFYRLFKTICCHYDIDFLALLDLNSWPDSNQINSLIVAINQSDGVPANLTVLNIEPENTIFSNLKSSIVPKKWSKDETVDAIHFYGDLKSKRAITFPLHTPTFKHFGLIGIIDDKQHEHFNLADAAYKIAIVFEKFNETIMLPSGIPAVSPREPEILKWSSEGKTSQEIALILGLSEHTINSYTTRVQQKLRAVNRAQMVASAMRIGLIS